MNSEEINLVNVDLKALFQFADKIGNKHYHRLTQKDFQKYLKYNHWRYISGDYECGTTESSKIWVKDNSRNKCPACLQKYTSQNWKTIDHKLPRSHYPWLSMEFDNFWVICKDCNAEKSDMNWFEYEHYIFTSYSHLYSGIKFARPIQLLKALNNLNTN
jgi:hypothetical protein